MHEGSPFLSLPPELRELIWLYLIGNTRIHILQDGSSSCNQIDDVCFGPHECHDHLSFPDLKCSTCKIGRPAALARTCRQLHEEFKSRIFQNISLSFTCGDVFLTFTNNRLANSYISGFSWVLLQDVHLHMGPAKYGDTTTNTGIRTALKTLSVHARNLKKLTLTMSYYIEARTDPIVLSNKTLEIILRLQNLHELKLRMSAPLPGPVGQPESTASFPKVLRRLQCLNTVLTQYTCKQRIPTIDRGNEALPSPSPSRRVSLRQAKTEIMRLIEDISDSDDQI